MQMNWAERALVQLPGREWLLRNYEARRLLALGGAMRGGRALEIGCGNGSGARAILDLFGADRVDAVDLDPRLVRVAERRTRDLRDRINVATGDATEIDAGDEVMLLAPYFPEYVFYIQNHHGRVVVVPTGEGFQLDVEQVARHLTPKTRAVIVNTPNNPSGVVYDPAAVADLGRLLDRLGGDDREATESRAEQSVDDPQQGQRDGHRTPHDTESVRLPTPPGEVGEGGHDGEDEQHDDRLLAG